MLNYGQNRKIQLFLEVVGLWDIVSCLLELINPPCRNTGFQINLDYRLARHWGWDHRIRIQEKR